MASFHHQIRSGKKGSALQRSNYIAREGRHSRREDLIISGHGNLPPSAGNDPRCYWRSADEHERANGATFREHEIAIPAELTMEQQIEVVKQHVLDIAKDKPHQYAVHAVKSSLEGLPNVHLHLMVSDRIPDGIERSLNQTFKRYNATRPEKGGCRKASGGRTRMQLRDEVITLRKRTADVQNEALEKHGHASRVDHRSLKEQGVKRRPEHHLGQARIRTMSGKAKRDFVLCRRDKMKE